MPDIYCLCFDLLVERLFIKPLAEVAACNLLSISKCGNALCTSVVVSYTLSRAAAEQIITEKKLEALCKMSVLCGKEYKELNAERDRKRKRQSPKLFGKKLKMLMNRYLLKAERTR